MTPMTWSRSSRTFTVRTRVAPDRRDPGSGDRRASACRWRARRCRCFLRRATGRPARSAVTRHRVRPSRPERPDGSTGGSARNSPTIAPGPVYAITGRSPSQRRSRGGSNGCGGRMGDGILFSHASPDDPVLRRIAIRTIERLTGNRAPAAHVSGKSTPPGGRDLWDAAVRELELRVKYDETRLRAISAIGPAVIVANHLCVLDGIVISHLVAKIRTDFKLLTNSVLCRTSGLRPHLLPIDLHQRLLRAPPTCAPEQTRCPLCAGGAWWCFRASRGDVRADVRASCGRSGVEACSPPRRSDAPGRRSCRCSLKVRTAACLQLASHISLTRAVAAVQRGGVQQDRQRGRGPHRRPGALCELSHIAERKALADHLRRMTYQLGERDDCALSCWRACPPAPARCAYDSAGA